MTRQRHHTLKLIQQWHEKKFRLRLSERADFQIVSTLFRAVQALAMRIYMSFSVKN